MHTCVQFCIKVIVLVQLVLALLDLATSYWWSGFVTGNNRRLLPHPFWLTIHYCFNYHNKPCIQVSVYNGDNVYVFACTYISTELCVVHDCKLISCKSLCVAR